MLPLRSFCLFLAVYIFLKVVITKKKYWEVKGTENTKIKESNPCDVHTVYLFLTYYLIKKA